MTDSFDYCEHFLPEVLCRKCTPREPRTLETPQPHVVAQTKKKKIRRLRGEA